MYFLGVDGGGTKTHCVIGDEQGNVCAEGFGGAANYHTVGMDVTKQSIETAISRALSKLNIRIEDIRYAVLGLAGADYEEDFVNLRTMCETLFKGVAFEIVNDCLVGLRAGSEAGWGIVSICGTGHGAMGKGIDGRMVELRNMDYTLGNRGGGGELIREALHHAFRADEGVEKSTRLQTEIPKLLNVGSMSEVDQILRTKGNSADGISHIPVLVSRLAKEEDVTCQDMMISMGTALGQTAAGIIRRLGVKEEKVPVVLLGSVFTGDNPLLIDAYRLEVHKVAPKAEFKILDKKPVMGAYYLALDTEK